MTQASKTCVADKGRRSSAVWPAMVMIVGALVGCGPSPEPVKPAPATPTPQERFDRLVSALEEKLGDSALGSGDVFAAYNAPLGTPITDAKVKVKHSLTPSGGEGGAPHAQLCLITEAKVRVTLPPKSGDDDDEDESSSKKKENKSLGEGLPSRESLVVPTREEAASRLGGSGVHEIDPGVTQRCFELEYRDGQWVLLTELDKENEPFNALAIEYALKKQ